ncbi:DUF2057 domain-containing protein [Neptunomonas antarctica]|uniref:Uncharacterized conserved protein YccT, UPF0319 family n=1 Tax=Neptunomonas antarctica TaxID=619304 RepID=A0A1N7LP07_9GAMM|nr:DUF2057 domain-containing protein [Neptunomonas antarctica]SIS75560.1 Uncharacterized conserved protein YccT, UPF0319 family [Neptunomonas antarctica]
MSLTKSCLLISLISVAVNVNADITLYSGEGVSLLAINGHEIKSGNFLDGQNSIHLENGTHQLVAQYTAEISKDGDFEIEKTSTQIIVFKADNAMLQLSAPKLSTYKELDDFNKQMNWKLFDQKANVAFSFTSDELKKEGIQFSRDYERELSRFNNSASPAALSSLSKERYPNNNPSGNNSSTGSIIHSVSLDDSGVNTVDSNNIPEGMLKYWYTQADIKTQKAFIKWLKVNQ